VGAREEVGVDPEKKNPADFVLWMKRTGKYKDHMMHWDSPWGDGFPGWHIECSAMNWKLLGEKIDIHTGGSDLISVHHPNEIAQNYGAFRKKIVKYWLHNEFVSNMQGDKLSKTKKMHLL
jgi:cysteinyl-tRNA synthetase